MYGEDHLSNLKENNIVIWKALYLIAKIIEFTIH